jgi:hypothetical protein
MVYDLTLRPAFPLQSIDSRVELTDYRTAVEELPPTMLRRVIRESK